MAGPYTLDGFDPDRYAPMARLLDEAEFEFVASRLGTGHTAVRRMKAERRNLFRQYLRQLQRDWAGLEVATRHLIVHSEADPSDLAGLLLRESLRFRFLMACAHLRLCLNAAGLSAVDARPLVRHLSGMQALCLSGARPQAIGA